MACVRPKNAIKLENVELVKPEVYPEENAGLKMVYIVIHMEQMMKYYVFRMVDQRKELSLFSSQDYCQRFSPSPISDTQQVGYEPAQKLSSDIVHLV